MVSFHRSILYVVTLLLLLFFFVYAFFPMSDEQEVVREWLNSGEEELFFGPLENSHMDDVSNLFSFARILFVVLLFCSLYLISKNGFREKKVVGISLALIPLVLLLFPWEIIFELFHKLFFPMGNYSFPPSSLLIMLFPGSFFLSFAIFWGILSFFTGILLFLSEKIIRFV